MHVRDREGGQGGREPSRLCCRRVKFTVWSSFASVCVRVCVCVLGGAQGDDTISVYEEAIPNR